MSINNLDTSAENWRPSYVVSPLLCTIPSILSRMEDEALSSNCQGLWLEIRFPGDVSVVLDLLCSYLQVKASLIFSCTPRGSASILHKRAFNIYELIDFQWISAAVLFLVIEASLQPIRPSSPSPMCGAGCCCNSLPMGSGALRLSLFCCACSLKLSANPSLPLHQS